MRQRTYGGVSGRSCETPPTRSGVLKPHSQKVFESGVFYVIRDKIYCPLFIKCIIKPLTLCANDVYLYDEDHHKADESI